MWNDLEPEPRNVLSRVAQGQNFSEVAVQLKVDPETVKSYWEKVVAACRAVWELKPEDAVDEAWIQKNFGAWSKLPTIEMREMQPGSSADDYKPKSQDQSLTTLSGDKLTWDSFDYTLVIEAPDGTGAQLTYVFPKTKPGEPLKGKLTKAIELSKRRVRALAEMSKKQGTFQETAAGREARLKLTPAPTLCNAWPVNVGTTVGGAEAESKVEDEQASGEASKDTGLDVGVGAILNDRSTVDKKTSDLNLLNPESAARKYGAWRTWADTPEGPKPGDVYSFWLAKVEWDKNIDDKDKTAANLEKAKITRDSNTNKHVGVFKSRRPNPDGKTETWTVTDGGQGKRQEIRERYRTFHIATQIFTTGAADGGQQADPRWISGWLDLDAYYTNPETKGTKADYEKWKTDTDNGKKGTRPQGAASIKGEQWPTEVELTGTPPQRQDGQPSR